MRMTTAILLVCLGLGAAEPAPPPVVIRSEPVSGAEEVDPELSELRVTFSQPMSDASWSWTTAGYDAFPEGAGQIRYLDDARTCVMPVKLVPGRTYVLGINSAQHRNFKSAGGQPALPWLLTFRTASAASGPETAMVVARSVAGDLQAQRFDAVFDRFDPVMRAAVPSAKLAEVLAEAGRQGGAFIAYGAPACARAGAYRVVTMPATWQRFSAVLEVSFDARDRIAGLYLRPAPPQVRLGTWRWSDPTRRRPDGAALDGEQLRIAATGAATVALASWEQPGISETRFALAARIRCQGVGKPGHLELWTVLGDGRRFFSRTLAESGPMGRLIGDQPWRDILLPADASGTDARPAKLELNLVLPDGGTVELGPLQLAQYAIGSEIVPVLPEGAPPGP